MEFHGIITAISLPARLNEESIRRISKLERKNRKLFWQLMSKSTICSVICLWQPWIRSFCQRKEKKTGKIANTNEYSCRNFLGVYGKPEKLACLSFRWFSVFFESNRNAMCHAPWWLCVVFGEIRSSLHFVRTTRIKSITFSMGDFPFVLF